MSRGLILRPARPEDAPGISEIFLAARRGVLPDLPEIYTDDEVRVWIREVVMKRTAVWVAETNGELAGFLSLGGQTLEHMYVHPEFQRRNVGTRLLSHARTLSPGRLELYTFARNEGARRFYERHGFRPIAFGQDNEENEPDVLYEWVPLIVGDEPRERS